MKMTETSTLRQENRWLIENSRAIFRILNEDTQRRLRVAKRKARRGKRVVAPTGE